MSLLIEAPSSASENSIAGVRWKYLLWALMGLATLSVVFYSEIPLLHQRQEREHLRDLRWLLLPHAVMATFALVSGPFQLSNRLRRRYTRAHRVLGRLYVGSVFLAAPLAMLSTLFAHYPRAIYFQTAIAIQGSAWLATTAIALVAAMRRRIAQHCEWMIRSYAVTFTFVGTRVLQPIPAWNRLGRLWFAVAIVCFTCMAMLVPRLMRLWRDSAARSA